MTRTPERHLHTSAVCRSEAEARRDRDPVFAAVLDRWADNAARRASEAPAGGQPDLFRSQP